MNLSKNKALSFHDLFHGDLKNFPRFKHGKKHTSFSTSSAGGFPTFSAVFPRPQGRHQWSARSSPWSQDVHHKALPGVWVSSRYFSGIYVHEYLKPKCKLFENRRMSHLCRCFSLCLGLNIQSVLKRFVKYPQLHLEKTEQKTTIHFTTCLKCMMSFLKLEKLQGWLFRSSRPPACFSSCPKMQAHPISCVLGSMLPYMALFDANQSFQHCDISLFIEIFWYPSPEHIELHCISLVEFQGMHSD